MPETTRRPIRQVLRAPVVRFMEIEASGGIALVLAAVAALVWVNGPFGDSYHDVWTRQVTLFWGELRVTETLEAWVNDGLMTVFFFVVGLEVKRELVVGELSDRKAAALPIVAAVGGMVVPALIYLAIAGGEAPKGWGVPVATDIAFALGVLVLLGSRVPGPLKIFLLTLAVADDIGGILVIAAFYTDNLSFGWLLVSASALAVVTMLRRWQVVTYVFYVVLGVVAWYAMLRSGIHATIAGVALGLLTPAQAVKGRQVLTTLEDRLHPWSTYVIVPLFALANAGVAVGADALAEAFTSPVALGIMVGLVGGKTVGVSLAAWVAVRSGIGRLPSGVTMRHIVGAAMLAGIGFTVALFIGHLAFETTPEFLDQAKIAILSASVIAGVAGASWLILTPSGESARGGRNASAGAP